MLFRINHNLCSAIIRLCRGLPIRQLWRHLLTSSKEHMSTTFQIISCLQINNTSPPQVTKCSRNKFASIFSKNIIPPYFPNPFSGSISPSVLEAIVIVGVVDDLRAVPEKKTELKDVRWFQMVKMPMIDIDCFLYIYIYYS